MTTSTRANKDVTGVRQVNLWKVEAMVLVYCGAATVT